MSDFQGQLGSNKIVDEGYNTIQYHQSLNIENQNFDQNLIERQIKSEQFGNEIVIILQYQFFQKGKNINDQIQIEIPEVRNFRDHKFYFFSVILQLCSCIEEKLTNNYKICHVQVLEILQQPKKQSKLQMEQRGKISLDVKSKQQVINAYEQNNQGNVNLNDLTLKGIALEQLMQLNLNQIFELQEMKQYKDLKEVIFNFQIELN